MSPLTARGQQTRDRILRAAVSEFSTKGFARTSVDDVLRASHTGKSQFYHYFENKAGLVRAVLRHQRTEDIPFRNPAHGHLDSWERITAWFDRIGNVTGAGGNAREALVGALPMELLQSEDPLRHEVLRTTRLRLRLLHHGLRRMKNRGELQADTDPLRLATFAAAALEGAIHLSRIEGSADRFRIAIDETIAHLRSHASGLA